MTRLQKHYVIGAATHHGRILVLNRDYAKESTGSWITASHAGSWRSGPGGGGEEMGGARGVKHYMQRAAIQGSPDSITASLLFIRRMQSKGVDEKHPFKKYFEELQDRR